MARLDYETTARRHAVERAIQDSHRGVAQNSLKRADATANSLLSAPDCLEDANSRKLDYVAQTVSECAYERCQAQDRNLQTFWPRVRANEQDSFSTIRPEKMVCNWFRGVPVRASCRCWFQFSIAIRRFSITSSDPGRDSSLFGRMETLAGGS